MFVGDGLFFFECERLFWSLRNFPLVLCASNDPCCLSPSTNGGGSVLPSFAIQPSIYPSPPSSAVLSPHNILHSSSLPSACPGRIKPSSLPPAFSFYDPYITLFIRPLPSLYPHSANLAQPPFSPTMPVPATLTSYLPTLLVKVSPTSAVPDDSSFSTLPQGQVDYLSHDWREEDVWRSWRSMTRQKNAIANGMRLENASWRTWWKQRNKLKTINPETLNW